MLLAVSVKQSSSACLMLLNKNDKVQTHSLKPGLTGLLFNSVTAWINTEAITMDFRQKIPNMPFTGAVVRAAAADWLAVDEGLSCSSRVTTCLSGDIDLRLVLLL
ncbi:unnamed protein product [Lota lota]